MEFRNRVMQITTSAGAGPLTFASTTPGYNSFVTAFGQGTRFYYCIDAGSSYEIGKGYVDALGQLQREALIESTTGALLELLGGDDVKVFATVPAQRLTNFMWDKLDNVIFGASGEAIVNPVVSSGAATLDLSKGRVFYIEAQGNVALSFSNLPTASGVMTAAYIYVKNTNTGTGSFVVTLPPGWSWGANYQGAQTVSVKNGTMCGMAGVSLDTGTKWLGSILGRGW